MKGRRTTADERAKKVVRRSPVSRREKARASASGDRSGLGSGLGSLPARPTRFFGRETELAAVRDLLLAPDVRLSEAYREALSPPDQVQYDASMSKTRAALTEEEFAAARAEGRSMTLEETVAQALLPSSPSKKHRRALGNGPLTRREHEIAVLVAQGLSNREIGKRLSIAERTAETHIGNILNKLSFHSRTQIAAWAARD